MSEYDDEEDTTSFLLGASIELPQHMGGEKYIYLSFIVILVL